MKVFSVGPDGGFTEYDRVPFENDHAESILEDWLESNPDGILEDGPLMIIGRQVPTDLGKSIDLLGVDREGNVVVIELKRGRTPRDVVAQALEYAAFAEGLGVDALESIIGDYRPDEPLGLAEHHRDYFGQSEAVAFNKDQRIVIIGQQVTPEIRHTALFLGSKGIQVTCVEFSFFQAADGGRLLSQEIVVGGTHAKPRGSFKRQPVLSEDEFMKSCDEHGADVFARILDWARHKSLAVRWGTSRCSVSVDVDGALVAVCYACSPLSKKYGQSLRTALGSDYWGIRTLRVPPEVVEQLWNKAERTELFAPAGTGHIDLRCLIDRAFTDDEVDTLIAWCESVVRAIQEHGLKVTGESPRPNEEG